MNRLKRALLPLMLTSAMLTGCGAPDYDCESLRRPKREVVFVDKDPHQDKDVCSKKIRKGAGRKLSRRKRKALKRYSL